MSFPLRREQEFAADRISARISGESKLAAALVQYGAARYCLSEDFWPGVRKRPIDSDIEDFSPYEEISAALAAAHRSPRATVWRHLALAERPDYADSRPSIADRIASLGVAPPDLSPIEESAAVLLGDTAHQTAAFFNAQWREMSAAGWKAAGQKGRSALRRLDELDGKGGAATLSEALERAEIASEFISNEEGARRYADATRQHPSSANAWLGFGCSLVKTADRQGLAALDRAAEVDPSRILDCAQSAYRLLISLGDDKAAGEKLQQIEGFKRTFGPALSKLNSLYKKDRTESHNLSPSEIKQLQSALRCIVGLKSASLDRKSAQQIQNLRVYHLILTPNDARNFDYDGAARTVRDAKFPGALNTHFAVEGKFWMAAAFESASIQF